MTLILVGSGSSVLNHALGHMIDSFDEVVRFNDFQTIGYEKFVGTKTTIWSRNTGFDVCLIEGNVENYSTILVQHTRFPNEYTDPMVVAQINHTEIHASIHDEICEIIGVSDLNTSTGIQTIGHFSKIYPIIWIYGFDCFVPARRYFEKYPMSIDERHTTRESLYIEHLQKTGKVHVLTPDGK